MAKDKKYPLMQRPVVLPNGIVLKSPLVASPSALSFGQGPEPYPAEALIDAYAGKARNGAAIVTVNGPYAVIVDKEREPAGHDLCWDITVGFHQHYIAQLTDAIHSFGSLALTRFDIDQFLDTKYDVSTGVPTFFTEGDGTKPHFDKIEAPSDIMEAALERYVDSVASLKKDMGFDGIWLHLAYSHDFLGRLLSAKTNKRTDQYGGNIEGRSRFILELCRRVKERCGRRFVIEATLCGQDAGSDGNRLEDTCRFINLAAGLIDIVQVKGPTIDETHPIQFHEEIPYLDLIAAVKQRTRGVAIEGISGFFYPDTVEAALRDQKLDLVGMARAWISNFHYGDCIREGRSEDIVPCLRCNKCHLSSFSDPWLSVCSVNPVYGLEHRIDKLIKAPGKPRRVAVIGGGPAGMEAALIASTRGHQVTLYEKQPRLGGNLNVTENVSFKWPLQRFRAYLIRQVEKSPIQVRLNCAPTPEQIEEEGFDVVIAATGSVPYRPDIPGIEGENVMPAVDAYHRMDELREPVVIIGGAEIGVETGLYLGRSGLETTVLCRGEKPAADSTPVHYWKMFKDEWTACDRLTVETGARVSRIQNDCVEYTANDGTKRSIPACTVLYATGMRSLEEDALSFAEAGDRFFMVGDCRQVGNIQKLMRNAFMAASQF